ncbi:zincin-like metallopeptidase domain-containing protein [Runella sp. MFBS21]|uniref:zincin-like metallopeptidase domain-containing protein n=1 Tax=Runella sp. MFBS21 TaxID=3034018 RepID=UPI0023F92B6F|nr:zincin-like metallopeptidase domain-containing protein [Runella sp. MFBS21]MDF7816768.1 zincin-like metallopeptidase domain-containing protein [Runella sp. MFBS21]
MSTIELTQLDYSALTQQISLALPTAALAWEPAWHEPHPEDDILSPLRWNDQPYQGINMLRLWAAATQEQYPYPHWMTHQRAVCLGGELKDQAQGVRISYVQTRSATMGGDYAEGLAFYRSYTVYNVADLAGLPARYYELPKKVGGSNPDARHDTLEAFFVATKVEIVRGNEAMYLAESDQVVLPAFEWFESAAAYYATAAHELIHWSRHPRRLNQRVGDAEEEVIAELGACFLLATVGLAPSARQLSYLRHWLAASETPLESLAGAAVESVSYLQTFECR